MSSSENDAGNKKTRFSVYVGNISLFADKRDVLSLFQEVGHVSDMYLMKPENGMKYTYGFVRFTNLEDAKRAIHDLNGWPLKGLKIIVQLAQENYYDVSDYIRQNCGKPRKSRSTNKTSPEKQPKSQINVANMLELKEMFESIVEVNKKTKRGNLTNWKEKSGSIEWTDVIDGIRTENDFLCGMYKETPVHASPLDVASLTDSFDARLKREKIFDAKKAQCVIKPSPFDMKNPNIHKENLQRNTLSNANSKAEAKDHGLPTRGLHDIAASELKSPLRVPPSESKTKSSILNATNDSLSGMITSDTVLLNAVLPPKTCTTELIKNITSSANKLGPNLSVLQSVKPHEIIVSTTCSSQVTENPCHATDRSHLDVINSCSEIASNQISKSSTDCEILNTKQLNYGKSEQFVKRDSVTDRVNYVSYDSSILPVLTLTENMCSNSQSNTVSSQSPSSCISPLRKSPLAGLGDTLIARIKKGNLPLLPSENAIFVKDLEDNAFNSYQCDTAGNRTHQIPPPLSLKDALKHRGNDSRHKDVSKDALSGSERESDPSSRTSLLAMVGVKKTKKSAFEQAFDRRGRGLAILHNISDARVPGKFNF